MTKRITSTAAAVRAAASGGVAFVFASRANDLPDSDKQLNRVFASAKYSNFGCTACGTRMQARSETSPFCVTCGAGDKVHQVKASSEATITSSSNLTSLQCSVCDHATVMETDVVKCIQASSHPVHCSCCGKPMFAVKSSDSSGLDGDELIIPDDPPAIEADADDLDADDDGDIDIDDLEAAFMRAAKNPGAEFDEFSDDDIDDLSENDEARINSGGLDNFKGKQAPPFKKGQKPTNKASGFNTDDLLVPDDAMEDDGEDMVLEPFSMEEDDPVDVLDEPIAEVSTELNAAEDEFDLPDNEGDPLADAMELDDTEMALAFVRASGRVIAMKGHIAIASFSKKTAGKNAFLINSDALPAAARAAVNTDGLRAGLQSVGFQLIRVPVTSSLLIEKKVAAVRASVAKAEDDRKRNFANIFALAAAGLNRGSWRGFENPLRVSLERELENIGVERPKRIAAHILAESGLKYSKTLLEVSNKLSGMSASARHDLAASLDMTNAADPSEEDEEDDEPQVASALESRLTRPAKLTPVRASTSNSILGASAILAGKAPLSFASA